MVIKLGFDSVWISRIMTCVTMVSYSVLVNGHPRSRFRPTRGLRQGDSISPYLYLICAEELSILLNEAENNNLIKGVKVARNSPTINHLFFVDDSIVFYKAKMKEWFKSKFP